MSRMLVACLGVAVLVVACSSPAEPTPPRLGPQQIDGALLTRTGGCGDLFVWATTADDTSGITIQWINAASDSWSAGVFSETAQLPQVPVVVALVFGHGLSQLYCNDVRMPGIGETSNAGASEGTVELIVRPDAGGFAPAAHADLRLSDVVFRLVLGSEEQVWSLDELVIENVAVGWLAG